jgi:hypothetical protein
MNFLTNLLPIFEAIAYTEYYTMGMACIAAA